MIEGMPVSIDALGIGSGWALVCLFVVLFFRGQVVARKTYEDKAHEADEWRTESRIKDAQLAEKDKQLAHMAEVGRTVQSIMAAIQARREIEAQEPE